MERGAALVQRRTVRLLTVTQVLGGLGVGSTVSIGALLAEQVSGSAALSGMAATMSTIGAAVVAVPLARLAARRGRRVSLGVGAVTAAVGAMISVGASAIPSFPLLLVGLALLGSGSAVNLQARFAATDLAIPKHRARDLSIVVWSTTLGAVLGPNLIGPGQSIGHALGMPNLTGPFLFTIAAQCAAAIVYAVALRPDPLLLKQEIAIAAAVASGPISETSRPWRARFAIAAIALSHATMVSVMAMTPVHLSMQGATITIVGLVISVHIAGMYALSPVFGLLADRVGRMPVVLLGQGLFAVALVTTSIGSMSQGWMTFGLVFLGLGWSASTVAGSALLTESVATSRRTVMQGRSDLVMNLAGAVGGALAGPVLTSVDFSGLSMVAGSLVALVLLGALVLRMASKPQRSAAGFPS